MIIDIDKENGNAREIPVGAYAKLCGRYCLCVQSDTADCGDCAMQYTEGCGCVRCTRHMRRDGLNVAFKAARKADAMKEQEDTVSAMLPDIVEEIRSQPEGVSKPRIRPGKPLDVLYALSGKLQEAGCAVTIDQDGEMLLSW